MQASSFISSSETGVKGSRRFALVFLAIVVTGVIVFVAGSEWIVRTRVAPKDGFEQYRAMLRSATAPIATFGDSHVANAIRNGGDIVNLGYSAETLPLMLFKARTYADEKKPKAIILQFSPQQFALYRADNAQEGIREELAGTSQHWLQFIKPHFRRYLLGYWRGILEEAVSPSKAVSTGPAQAPRMFSDWPEAEQRKSAEIRVQLHAPLAGGPSTDRLLASLTDTIADLRNKGVETCVVRYPLSEVYRKAASAAPSFAQLSDRIRGLADKNGFRFVDLSSSFPDALFGDPDHIATSNQAIVTKTVLERCLSPRT
jgi:hypothetical protein